MKITVIDDVEKRQKSRFFGFLQKSLLQNQKSTFTVKLNPCSIFEVTFSFLFVSRAELQPFVLVHPGLASIFDVTTALHRGK